GRRALARTGPSISPHFSASLDLETRFRHSVSNNEQAMSSRRVPQQPDPKTTSRSKISQADVPGYSLDEALRVPRAIADNYGYKPTKPLNVAAAMGMTPNSGPFRMIAGA